MGVLHRAHAGLGASYALVERNMNLVRRYAGWELVFLTYTVVNTLTIGLIAVGGPAQSAEGAVLYLIIGALLWGFLSVLFSEVSHSVQWERWEGTIEYTFMAPVSRLSYLGGACMFAVIYGFARTAVILAVAALFFGLSLAGANLLAAVIILAVSSLSFVGLGLVAAVLPLMSPEKGAQATHIVQAFILLVSGVYYEVEVLPGWLRWFSHISPATYTLRAARQALSEGAATLQLLPDIGILALFGAVLIPVGVWVFSLGERYALRTGKLKRSG